jgi:hypothetical protein
VIYSAGSHLFCLVRTHDHKSSFLESSNGDDSEGVNKENFKERLV